MRSGRLTKIVAATAVAAVLAACSTTTTPAGEGEAPEVDRAAAIPEEHGPGVTDRAIAIADSLFDPDTHSEVGKFYAAMAAYYNENGGILGRRLTFTSGPDLGKVEDPNAYAEQVCDAFAAQKEHFAYLMDSTASGQTASCLNALGVVTLDNSYLGLVDDAFLTGAPYSFAPEGISRSALDRATIATMAAQGALDGHKVALIGPTDTRDDVEEVLAPLAEESGAEQAEGFYFDPDNRESSLLTVTLKLKQGGYDTVITVTPKEVWTATGPFSLAATFASQGYAPTIGGALADGADAQRFGLGENDEALQKAVVYGWSRALFGIPDQQRVDLLLESPTAKRCEEWLDAAGIPLGDSANQFYVTCGDVQFLKDALEASGSEFVNAEAVATGAEKLSGAPGGAVFEREFGPSKQYGVSAVRLFAYDPASQSLSYDGGDVEIEEP